MSEPASLINVHIVQRGNQIQATAQGNAAVIVFQLEALKQQVLQQAVAQQMQGQGANISTTKTVPALQVRQMP